MRINSRFFANAGWIMLGSGFQMMTSLVVGMLTARYLGPAAYGLLNYSAAFVAFFTAVTNLGLNGIFVKEIIDRPNKEGALLGSAILMRLTSSLLSILTITGLVYVLNPHDRTILIVTILQSTGLLFQSFDTFTYWYQSRLQSKIVSIIQIVAYTAMTVYRIILLVLGKNVVWFALPPTISLIIIAVLLTAVYHRNGGERLRYHFEIAKDLLSRSHHFIVSGIMIVVYVQMDRILIGQMMDKKSVGLYSAASYICVAWAFVLSAIIDSARPVIITAKAVNKEIYSSRIKQLYATIIWLSFSVSLIISIFAKPIIILLYGTYYLSAITSLRILTWQTAFSYLGVARNIWIVCENKHKFVKMFSFIGVACNAVLNIVLIPQFGFNGSAIATLITEILTAFVLPFLIKETRENSVYVAEAFIFKGVMVGNSATMSE